MLASGAGMSDTTVTLLIRHGDKQGEVHLDFQPWAGEEIPINFRDDLYRRSGVLRFDGRTGNAAIIPTRPYVGDLSDPQALSRYAAGWLQMFGENFKFGWSPEPDRMPRYDEEYHASHNYIQGDPLEVEIKRVQAQIIRRLASPQKCVVGGCSNGELVRRCLEIGVDCWGFDVIPGIEKISFPEVCGRLKEGSLTAIPYSGSDGFDTLVAVDVLEHVPERDIPQMVAEWRRLDVTKLVLLVNLNQFWYPGHITLRPIDWWAEQWKNAFRLTRVESRFEDLPTVYSNAGRYNQQWTYWERK
jgi:hypothetical protein